MKTDATPTAQTAPSGSHAPASGRGRATAPLTGAIAAGDETAFERFYELWFDRALGLARKLTKRDEAFCLDVVQDVMLRVVKSIPRLADERAVDAWMGRTVFSTAIDRLRADSRRRRRERHAADNETDAAAGPAEVMFDAEQIEWLRARIAELPKQDQQMLADRFTHDRTLAETGAALGLSINATHGRVRRLVEKLRRMATEVFSD